MSRIGKKPITLPKGVSVKMAAGRVEVQGPKGKLQFARVNVERGDKGWVATPTGARGSNLISTVSRANGMALIPVGVELAPRGSQVRVMVFRAAED